MKMMAIFGIGGCGRGVLPIARQQLIGNEEPYQLVFVDDNPHCTTLNGHSVLRYSDWLKIPASSRHINIAIASGETREKLAYRCQKDGVGFFEVRSSTVQQMDDVQLGEGAVLSPFVALTSNIKIGRHFHANMYSYVEHDCQIGDFVTFAPGVKCNGNVIIKDYAYIGSGAVIKQGTPDRPLTIGRGAVVGMGAVVTKDVPEGATVVGNPARCM